MMMAEWRTYTGSVGDPTFLVVTRQTFLLLGGDVVGEEGGVTFLSQFVLTNNLVLPDSLWNLNRPENTVSIPSSVLSYIKEVIGIIMI